MKYIYLTILVILLSSHLSAQKVTPVSPERQKQLGRIVECLKNDDAAQLSRLIKYPLKRPNPVPDIKNMKEFVSYYHILFDSSLKQIFFKTRFTTRNTINKENELGLFNGDIWLNEKGQFISINYSSPKELDLQEELTKKQKQIIHPDVSEWKENIYSCETDKFIIRVDLLKNDSLKYVSWSKPKTISDKPDLIINNGSVEYQGSEGGVTFTFKNGDRIYIVDQVDICEKKKDCGLFLRVLFKDKLKLTTRLKEIK